MTLTAAEIPSRFRTKGDLVSVAPHGSGHIHDTYVSQFRTELGPRRYIHQRINRDVFRSPEDVMENIDRVTAHLRTKIVAVGGDPERRTLTIVPTLNGQSFYRSPEGDYWRTYLFIEGATTYDVVTNPRHVYSAARALGEFHRMIQGLTQPRLKETIPHFGDTRRRFVAFLEALDQNRLGRAANAGEETQFARQREKLSSLLVDLVERGDVPERIIHYDTKLNNVLIDDETGEGICVIDLDTVMPGTALYDFGDAVRSGAASAAEDEKDLSRAGTDLALFEQLTRGYLEVARSFLTDVELDCLLPAARAITFTAGVRFLTDYLSGDPYFKTDSEHHNLDRCRGEFAKLRDMEAKSDAMQSIIENHRR